MLEGIGEGGREKAKERSEKRVWGTDGWSLKIKSGRRIGGRETEIDKGEERKISRGESD